MKALKKIKDAITGLKCFPTDRKEFGYRIAMIRYRRKIGLISAQKYINIISHQMEKEIIAVTQRYQRNEIKSFAKKKDFGEKIPIFVMWGQGKESMPEWCKACYNNLNQILPDSAELIFITYDNYLSFIDIPQDIIGKFKKGYICHANYSDIIRYTLLATYGGGWIDAAIYLTGNIFDIAFQYDVYTPRFNIEGKKMEDASRGRWVGGVWFSKSSNILFKYVSEVLVAFWEKHNKALDYLACDYIIWTAYNNIREIRQSIDSIPPNNKNIRLLNSYFEEEFSQELYESILQEQKIHLVNRHKEYIKEKHGKKTIYGHILSINNVIYLERE